MSVIPHQFSAKWRGIGIKHFLFKQLIPRLEFVHTIRSKLKPSMLTTELPTKTSNKYS